VRLHRLIVGGVALQLGQGRNRSIQVTYLYKGLQRLFPLQPWTAFGWAASHHETMAVTRKHVQWTGLPWAQVLDQGCLDRVDAYGNGEGHRQDHGRGIEMAWPPRFLNMEP